MGGGGERMRESVCVGGGGGGGGAESGEWDPHAVESSGYNVLLDGLGSVFFTLLV